MKLAADTARRFWAEADARRARIANQPRPASPPLGWSFALNGEGHATPDVDGVCDVCASARCFDHRCEND